MAKATPDLWIDVSAALTQRAGIARYVRGLTEAPIPMAPTERGFTVGTYSHSWDGSTHRPFGVPHAGTVLGVRQWRLALLAGHLLRRTILPGLSRFQWFLATDMAVPFTAPKAVTATIHDLTTITHPETHSLLTKVNARLSLSRIRARGYRVVANSRRTARNAAQIAHIPQSRMTTMHPVTKEALLTPPKSEDIEAALRRHRATRPLVLTVGKLEPRKNLRRPITAFQSVATPNVSLIIVGAQQLPAQLGQCEGFRLANLANKQSVNTTTLVFC